MNPLLISGFGTSISVDKRRLIIDNKLDNVHYEFYPHQIPHDSIIIDGHTGSITFEAMRWLTKHNIPVTLLNWNGNLLSTTLPKEPVLAKLKIKQYEAYLDEKKRYGIAERIIKEKVNQSLDLLKELSRYHLEMDQAKIAASFANEDKFYGASNKDIRTLMTYEGRIADIYWEYLGKVFNKLYPEFHFKRRNNTFNSHNRNASDEVNALLNYGYAVLETEIRKDLNAVGLDPTIGFLHELKNSRASLVCDVQELYRWSIDLSVIQLLEDKKLKKSDFLVTENYHIRLKESAARMLIDKIRLNFNSKAPHRGRRYFQQNILYENVRELAAYILGELRNLAFNIPKVEVKREDDAKLCKRILHMLPEERRRTGMNKSTLWYIQRSIREGKKVKIYRKTYAKIMK